MMGAGIAYVTAKAGIDVVLKDVELASAEKGKAYSRTLVDTAVATGRLTQGKADELPGPDPPECRQRRPRRLRLRRRGRLRVAGAEGPGLP
ncbi:3-hydroxyacyl-CoA dehydrogenase NAD-binding domain-containing protein [Janibacter limosus]|uniref:3-hydroxyacyl-CoA dehydrogenase NAD-binding domain-containing protein n=1 Tax=Janibacter limosus TaxID=53458 RepID=UPI002342BD6C|nr:3-hydroxyacyl-CoA dehydrogenase NAD-binding domain-containing protein [Janibacter limosus]WKV16061.1 3-hydroxyacyl-CoA dehydrogenase NAD-binding domain-containing protein [Janibacter limosus]